ncbi:hypothetical protein HK105_208478 [Polyrhizophydium stewartii]|uniref:Uncharacterized protein n=1 Tax=Polyrhizophydium stewartii TaxID=2732419 RepID=A0ABR4MXV8_9FUNG
MLRGPDTCTDTRGVCCRDGQQIIDPFALGNPTLWLLVLHNVGPMAGFLIAGLVMFGRTSRPKLRLK